MHSGALVGVDVGGTFTDFVAWDGAQGWRRLKRPTSRPDPAQGILEGLLQLGYRGGEISHGTTAATNTALERSGPRLGLVTSAGFRDLLTLGRGERLDLYAVQSAPRPSLVAPEDCFEVTERLDARGQVLLPLDPVQVDRLAAELCGRGLTRVVVSLLFSYLNPAHELLVEERLRAAGLEVTLSHRVDPQPKEYERTSTAVLQAYLEPSLRRYLERLESDLAGPGSLWVVRSSGSVCRPQEAAGQAVGCLLSGPAAGLQGAWQVAGQLGFSRLLTVDVGGTSTDVALCRGELPFLEESSIGGMPFRCPQTEIHTIGAGGGSIAYVEESGLLQVGPRSAGSDPGPAAYGKGGPVTVSDALLYLGRLPEQLAGGALRLDRKASARALEELAGRLALDPSETAAAVLELAEQSMAAALRLISLERGHDPADFALVAFGGGGGSHGCSLADRLGMDTVVIPSRPGLLCAEGALLAPWQSERKRAWNRVWDESLRAELEAWRRQCRGDLRRLAPAGELSFRLLLEVRYRGQGHSLWLSSPADQLPQRFGRRHRQRFGYQRPDYPLELVGSLVRARVRRPQPPQVLRRVSADSGGAPRSEQAAWGLPPQTGSIQVWSFDFDGPISGPGRLETMDGTVWLPPGWQGERQPDGSWVLRIPGRSAREVVEQEEEHEK